MTEQQPDSENVKRTETYCDKQEMRSQDCAACTVAAKEDFEEKMRDIASILNLESTAIMFRLFHPARNTKAYWRTRMCRHFREIIKQS